MKYLLDTHILIWFLEGNELLPLQTRNLTLDSNQDISINIVSLWEMAIKISVGKLDLMFSLEDVIQKLREDAILIKMISLEDVLRTRTLPFHHKDPFDRILIAQSLNENIPIISRDEVFDAYSIQRIW